MKKLYSIALAVAVAATSATAYGAVPFAKGRPSAPRTHLNKASRASAPASATLINEDFSKFSEGSESAPAAEISYVNNYYVPNEYTAQPGWTAQGLRPAGGCVSLHPWTNSYGETDGGYISSPPLSLGGTATITFRAKAAPGTTASLWLSLCDDYYGPGDDQADYELTDEWQNCTLVASHGSLEDNSYFQFKSEEGIVLLDDIRLDFVRDRIATPQPAPARNISETEFIASWEDTGAPQYRLNVYYTENITNPITGEISTDFDGIKVNSDGKTIDTSAPNYPEGWYMNVSMAGKRDVQTDAGNFSSGPLSVVFDAVGDTLVTPVLPYPADEVSFWVKPSGTDDDDYMMSLLRVETFDSESGKWTAIAQLPHYYLNAEGGIYTFDSDALGKATTQVRFTMIQEGLVSFYVDDVTVHYRQRGNNVPVIKDALTPETEYTVTGVDHANDWYYYVEAIDGDIVSEKSYHIWVDGITGLKVTAKEATGITSNGFTANWEPLGHATNYNVTLSRVTVAKEDMADVVVLEENFDAITEGTIDNPGSDWMSPYDFGAHGMANSAWCATQPAWAAGMAGTQGTSLWGTAGLVYSPVLDLSNNGGQGFNVEATVVTTVDSFDFYGTTEPEGVYVMVLNSPYDYQAVAAALIETPVAGSTTAKVTVPNPEGTDFSNIIVTFMNKSGTMFFVDEVKITQDLKAGEILKAPFTSASTADTYYTFTDLPAGSDYGYTVAGSTTHEYYEYASDPSDAVVVQLSGITGIDDIVNGSNGVSAGNGFIAVTAADSDAVEVYTLQGICVGKATGNATFNVSAGMYIVKVGEKTYKVAVK